MMKLAQMALMFVSLTAAVAADPPPPSVIRIGLTKNMLPPEDEKKFDVVANNFKEVMMQQCGLTAEPESAKSAEELHKLLTTGSMHLGAFQGFEFAALKQKYPELEPVVMAMPAPDALFEVIVVAKDHPAQSLSECRGQTLVMSKEAREDTRFFLAHRCRAAKLTTKEMFSELMLTKSAEEALDHVVDGKAKLAAVDRSVWKMLERRMPGRANKLRILEQSEQFLPPVVAYVRGKLDPTIGAKFRDGMVNAHTTPKGGHLVSQIKIVKFEPIPSDYDKQLEKSLKCFPPVE